MERVKEGRLNGGQAYRYRSHNILGITSATSSHPSTILKVPSWAPRSELFKLYMYIHRAEILVSNISYNNGSVDWVIQGLG